MAEKDAFEQARIIGVQNRENVVNVVESKIWELTEHLEDFPGPYEPLNGTKYIIWERRAMMKIGIVQGWISALSAVEVLPFEIGEKLKHRALGIINRATAKVQMGMRQ
jgi:hypothetical protein